MENILFVSLPSWPVVYNCQSQWEEHIVKKKEREILANVIVNIIINNKLIHNNYVDTYWKL